MRVTSRKVVVVGLALAGVAIAAIAWAASPNPQILRSVLGRALGIDYQDNLVIGGTKIIYGHDQNTDTVLDLSTIGTGGLPSQTGNAGKFLTTDGTTASWGTPAGGVSLSAPQTWTALQTFGTNISIGGVTATGATGTGNAVFDTSPTLITPDLGTPSAINLTNASVLSLGIGAINATGVASSTTFLEGDGKWATPAGSAITGANNTIACNISGSTAALTACTPVQATQALLSQTANAQTVSYTVQSTDCYGEITENSASATAVTLNSGTCSGSATLTIKQLGAGAVTITLGAGVTLSSSGPYDPTGGLGGAGGYVQIQQGTADAWSLVAFNPGNATPALTGTCSAAASTALGLTGGTITLPASGTVASCTIIETFKVTAKNEWVGSMGDRTQLAVPMWVGSSSNTTSITYTLPGATAASDVLSGHAVAE